MKTIIYILPVLACVSCSHLTMMGHRSGYDINAEYQTEPITPVSMNVGFESESFVAVPPKESVSLFKNWRPKRINLPSSDVVPTITRLRIEKVNAPGTNATGGVATDYVTSGATGRAAIAAAGGVVTLSDGTSSAIGKTTEQTEKSQQLSNSIKEIATKTSSIKRTTASE